MAFISKSLSLPERNYEIHDKEMLAVIQCLEDWRHYLESTKKEFEIWMDHKNLQYFMSNQKLNHRHVMIRLGQAFWHQGTPAVIDGQLWELE